MTKINKPTNSITVTGTLIEHSLEVKESQNGRTFVRGQVVVDTSTQEGVTNEVKVNVLQFADKKDKKDKSKMIVDDRFDSVVRLMDSIGSDVRISASYNNSVFVQNGETRKASQVSGGFYATSNVGTKGARFKATALIKSIGEETSRNADGDDVPTGGLVLDVRVFNYNGSNWIPKKFYVHKDNKPAIAYFTNTDLINEGDVTDLWGNIVVESTTRIVESAFGGATEEPGASRTVHTITGARTSVYEMDEDLEEQLNGMRQAYNTYVAEQEQRDRDYQASKAENSGQATESAQSKKTKTGAFDF